MGKKNTKNVAKKPASKKTTYRQQQLAKKKAVMDLKGDEYIVAVQKLLKENPKMTVKPTATIFLDAIPPFCPDDGEILRNLRIARPDTKWGMCCLRCGKCYLLKKEAKGLKSVREYRPMNLCRKIISEPTSTILVATIGWPDDGKPLGQICIVSETGEQSTKNGIYWIGRTLPTMVLMAVQTFDKSFVYDEVEYKVLDFVAYRGLDKYLRIISRFCNPSSPQTVFVFAQKNISRFKTGQYEEVTAMIPCANRTFPVPVSVYYDKKTQKYFINEETYIMTRKAYGLPYLRLQTSYANRKGNNDFSALRQQSELNLMGYNVNATEGASTEERRKILRDAIDSGVLWKRDIINHLEWLIHTRAQIPNMENAVGEWKQDLMYISSYKADEQRKVWINKFKSRFSEKTLV